MTDLSEADGAMSGSEERRLRLLRQISEAGGALSPLADPHARHGYGYATVGDDVDNDLSDLARRNYLEARFFDRVSLCPKCGSHHLNVREVCPSCRRAHLTSEGLLHHFRCGYVGIPSEFLPVADGGYRCPKCNGVLRHSGTEFDRLGRAFVCRGCGVISENPPVEAVCLACGVRTPAENLVSVVVFSYVLTSGGAAAVRSGSLVKGDEESASAAGAPVLKRAVILEFLDHELKRRLKFKDRFSVLLAKYVPGAVDRNAPDLPAEWLERLRGGLREVDVIGQLADALYIVILPQTRQKEAETMRRRMEAHLGDASPLVLSTMEIAEQRDLAKALGGLIGRSDPP
jgi:hypothetical protein